MTEAQIKAVFGETAIVHEFTSVGEENDMFYLHFDPTTTIKAGTPYIIELPETGDYDAKDGFTITNTLNEEKNSTSTDDDDSSTDDSDDDSIDDSDDTPTNETQLIKTITTTKVVKKEPKKVKDKHNTGNPILLGVLAISLAGLAYQLRRKE